MPSLHAVPPALLGLDRDHFDRLYGQALGELARQVSRLNAAEAAAGGVEAARERLDAAVLDAAARPSPADVDPQQRAAQVVDAFRSATARILATNSPRVLTIPAGDATFVFQPVAGLEDGVRLQGALSQIPGLADVRVSHFSDGVCMIRARVTADPPLQLDADTMSITGWPVPRPVTDDPESRIYLSEQEGTS